jgi:hypothetical protein
MHRRNPRLILESPLHLFRVPAHLLVGAIPRRLGESIMARKTAAKPAKGNGKAKGKATPAPETEKRDNRYLRASRVIIESGDGIDLAELALRSDMSISTAAHCLESWRGVTRALIEAKILKPKPAPTKAPTAPEKASVPAQTAEEPVPA